MFRLWCERQMPDEYAHLLGEEAVYIGCGNDDPEDLYASLAPAQAVIAGARIRFDVDFMARAPGLQVICRTGIGYDNVVLADATENKVCVCNTPDAPKRSTAEHAITLMLAVAKEVKRNDRELRRREVTDFFGANQGIEIEGLLLGLVGLGRIGAQVAGMARGLGMRVVAYDPYVDDARLAALGVERAETVETVLSQSDVVSLHAPLTPETRHLLNRETLALMRPGSILVNAARGGLVDEGALLEALESGHLHGAGLDTFDPEPPRPDNPLLHRDDVIATPHIAAVTIAGKQRMWSQAIAQCLQVLRGERPPHLINAEVWDRL